MISILICNFYPHFDWKLLIEFVRIVLRNSSNHLSWCKLQSFSNWHNFWIFCWFHCGIVSSYNFRNRSINLRFKYLTFYIIEKELSIIMSINNIYACWIYQNLSITSFTATTWIALTFFYNIKVEYVDKSSFSALILLKKDFSISEVLIIKPKLINTTDEIRIWFIRMQSKYELVPGSNIKLFFPICRLISRCVS